MIDIKMKNTCQIVLKDYKKGKKKFTLTIEFIGNPLKVATAACLFLARPGVKKQTLKMAAVSGLICTIKHVKILDRFNFVGFSEESAKWHEGFNINRRLFSCPKVCISQHPSLKSNANQSKMPIHSAPNESALPMM